MKRDMDLARKILFAVEACNDPLGPQSELKIEGYSDQMISYHVKVLAEAGLLEAEDVSEMGSDGFRWWAESLTWQGHEFLEAARDDTRWPVVSRLNCSNLH
jgi:DNA-binding transcriptional ArsR family regulator